MSADQDDRSHHNRRDSAGDSSSSNNPIGALFSRRNSTSVAIPIANSDMSASRRRMSVNTLGLSGTSTLGTAGSAFPFRRGSLSTSSYSNDSIDENAVDEDDETPQIPSLIRAGTMPFRRMSLSQQAMGGMRPFRGAGAGAGSPGSNGNQTSSPFGPHVPVGASTTTATATSASLASSPTATIAGTWKPGPGQSDVSSGETLGSMARRHSTSVHDGRPGAIFGVDPRQTELASCETPAQLLQQQRQRRQSIAAQSANSPYPKLPPHQQYGNSATRTLADMMLRTDQGFSWSEHLRNRAQSLAEGGIVAARPRSPPTSPMASASAAAPTQVTLPVAESRAEMPLPPTMAPKPKVESKKPPPLDPYQERILKCDFYMD